MRKAILLLALLLLLTACAVRLPPEAAGEPPAAVQSPEEPLPPDPEPIPPPAPERTEEDPAPSADPEPVEPADADFVRVEDYIPHIAVDLRYASADNFTGTVIYDFSEAYLRYGTVKKLRTAQEALSEQGYGLLIWDAFRPTAAQFALWEVCPDPAYVADPNQGFSSHSRGNTVDVTLVTADGEPVEMPTDFDDFSPSADRDYSDVSESAAANALLLEEAMEAAGFRPYQGEWWHFSDRQSFDVEEIFVP